MHRFHSEKSTIFPVYSLDESSRCPIPRKSGMPIAIDGSAEQGSHYQRRDQESNGHGRDKVPQAPYPDPPSDPQLFTPGSGGCAENPVSLHGDRDYGSLLSECDRVRTPSDAGMLSTRARSPGVPITAPPLIGSRRLLFFRRCVVRTNPTTDQRKPGIDIVTAHTPER